MLVHTVAPACFLQGSWLSKTAVCAVGAGLSPAGEAAAGSTRTSWVSPNAAGSARMACRSGRRSNRSARRARCRPEHVAPAGPTGRGRTTYATACATTRPPSRRPRGPGGPPAPETGRPGPPPRPARPSRRPPSGKPACIGRSCPASPPPVRVPTASAATTVLIAPPLPSVPPPARPARPAARVRARVGRGAYPAPAPREGPAPAGVARPLALPGLALARGPGAATRGGTRRAVGAWGAGHDSVGGGGGGACGDGGSRARPPAETEKPPSAPRDRTEPLAPSVSSAGASLGAGPPGTRRDCPH